MVSELAYLCRIRSVSGSGDIGGSAEASAAARFIVTGGHIHHNSLSINILRKSVWVEM